MINMMDRIGRMTKLICIWSLVLYISVFVLNAQDCELYYRVFGTGEPVLIINGGPGMNSEGFSGVAQSIADMGYQTIVYDQRGTGKSCLESIDTNTITMDLMIDDIESLRKKLGFSDWVVFGQSFGGVLATHYAAKHPEVIRKIIFSCSGGVNLKFTSYVQTRLHANLSKNDSDSLHYFQSLVSGGDTTANTLNLRASYLAKAYLVNDANAHIIANRLTQVNFRINRLVLYNLQKIKFDYKDKMNDFTKPVLVLQGDTDVISVETAREVHQTFPNSTLHILKDCGHYGWLDKKEEYYALVEVFLQQA